MKTESTDRNGHYTECSNARGSRLESAGVAAPYARRGRDRSSHHADCGGDPPADYRTCWCTSSGFFRRRRAPSLAGISSLRRTWDPVAGDFGALPFIYGTLVTSAVALVDRGSSGRGRRHFSGGACAAQTFLFSHFCERFARGGPQRDLRIAGRVPAGAASCGRRSSRR